MEISKVMGSEIGLAREAYADPLMSLMKVIARHREEMASLEAKCAREIIEIIERYAGFSAVQQSEFDSHRARMSVIRDAISLAREIDEPSILAGAIDALKFEIENRPRFLSNLKDFIRESE